MKCKVKIALMFLSVILLVGCATPAERAAQEHKKSIEVWSKNYRAQQDRQEKCSGYGFQSGTTAFAQCLQQAEQQESMDKAIMLQQSRQLEAERQEHFRRAQCYASQTGSFKLCP